MFFSPRPRLLQITLWFIALVQLVLGLAFLLVPEAAAVALHFPAAPGWVNWLLGMMAARCLGFAYGLWLVARTLDQARPWVVAMVGIQALDWVVTVKYLAIGAVSLSQVTTAAFLPVLFVVALLMGLPRKIKHP